MAQTIVKFMEFLNGDLERKPFECEIRENIADGYEVRVLTGNSAYDHEVNALVMAIDGCQHVTAWQEVDENGKILWKIW